MKTNHELFHLLNVEGPLPRRRIRIFVNGHVCQLRFQALHSLSKESGNSIKTMKLGWLKPIFFWKTGNFV
jgi:hypothetical protein